MRELVVVAGTGTGVGKTWAAARLASRLREAGVEVAARKPVQSFDPLEHPTDAEVLARASGEPELLVCAPHRSYARPMAPPMAADALRLPRISISDLVGEIDLPATGVILVEGVGGPRSPLAHDGDTVGLAGALDADRVLLVARPGLGTINEVLLSVAAFGARPVTVFVNRFEPNDELHRVNRRWLSETCGLDVEVRLDQLADRYTILGVS